MPEDLASIFKPEAKTILKIFCDADSYYQIPDYQRPYSWNTEQIEEMWDDIYSAMEANDESYFLGPLILIDKKGYFEVVDGQQRLTTLTILFCVLRDLHLKNNNRIINAIRSLADQQYRLRLITQDYYQNQFEHQILDSVEFPESLPSKKELEKNKFINAALIFREKLSRINTKELSPFVDYIMTKVIMISITCTKQSFAIKLFQVLNTRGLDLENADLIKSHLYGTLNEGQVQRQFMATWAEVENISKEIDEPMENLFTFYEYYLLASNPKRSLFEELKAKFEKDANKAIFLFKQFVNEFSEVWKSNKRLSRLLYSFKYLPNQVFWKAILTTARYGKFGDFEGLCRELRKMFYSYWIAGYTTSKIKQLSFNIIGMLKDKEQKTLSEIKKVIENKMAADNVIKLMSDNICNDAYGDAWLKPLLILIEYEQTDNAKIVFIDTDRKLHIDHVLPEKWETKNYWRKHWTKEKVALWSNRIGNLTLLSGKKNIAASNGSFPDKRDIYNGKGRDEVATAFLISQKISDPKVIDWTEKEVKRRQSWLIRQTEKLLDIKIDK
jgi:uncharacterized protein with ParB-like and HNH nuclease domain